jgi:hypothetical protein
MTPEGYQLPSFSRGRPAFSQLIHVIRASQRLTDHVNHRFVGGAHEATVEHGDWQLVPPQQRHVSQRFLGSKLFQS